MRIEIDTPSGSVTVVTHIYDDTPSCNSASILAGPFIFALQYPRVRKELIAALLAADAELDAAAEKREVEE